MNQIKFYMYLIIVVSCLNLISCSQYYCLLNSRGQTPVEKTYYIVSIDKETNLEFKEYSGILKERLKELGYIESVPHNAAIRILFDYDMGEKYLVNNSTSARTYGSPYYTNSNIEHKNTYKIPLYVTIKAFDNKTEEPIWEVDVRDDLDRETQMQSAMPWLLLCTQEYIGKSSNGEQMVKIKNTTKIKAKYNLIWPSRIDLLNIR